MFKKSPSTDALLLTDEFSSEIEQTANVIKQEAGKVVGLDMKRMHATLRDVLEMAEKKVAEIEEELKRLNGALIDAKIAYESAKIHFNAIDKHLNIVSVAVHTNIQSVIKDKTDGA